MSKANQALQALHLIRNSEIYREKNRKRTHLNKSENELLDYAIKSLQEFLKSESVGV